MISVDDDIAVAVDDAWKSYWKLRYGTVNYDIESLTIGKKGRITNLGRPLISAAELDYRFIGLLRFTTAGCQQLLNVYDEHKKENTSWAQSGKPFKQGFMTDWLDEAIQKGVKIMPHITHHGWLEFDTAEDYELALGLKRKGLLNQFIQLELEQ